MSKEKDTALEFPVFCVAATTVFILKLSTKYSGDPANVGARFPSNLPADANTIDDFVCLPCESV
jgi:hypothetical protein